MITSINLNCEENLFVGIGNDLIDIRRIGRVLEKYNKRFLNRIYTEEELRKAESRKKSNKLYISTLAKRFAAKEATAKALGTGFRNGVFWRDIGVLNLSSGKPTIKMIGGAKKQLNSLISEQYLPVIDLTMTDEYPYAEAFVIISAVAKENYTY